MFAHEVLASAGSDAGPIATLWWVFLAISIVVYVIVIAALWFAVRRARTRRDFSSGAMAVTDARSGRIVAAAMAVTVLTLTGMLITELVLGRGVLDERLPAGDAVRIQLTAQQFWWQADYQDASPQARFTTANELVVPVGRPIELRLRSQDVIHSFWVPALAGKKDLIPGIDNTLRFSVRDAGNYEGQCAEFCGYQHANMRIIVTAVEPDEYQDWTARQRAVAAAPGTEQLQRGQWVFERSSCALCHRVRGTGAQGAVGPDLTHFGSRRRIAASALRNTPAALSAWITNPQGLKPGARMPATVLPAEDLRALVAWLGSLQ